MNTSTSLTRIALQKFKKNLWGVFSFGFLILCVFIAVFAYVMAPDNSKNANQMHLSIHSKAPGFKVLMLTIPGEQKSSSSFSDYFFGRESVSDEIPISGYSIVDGKIQITEYTSDGLEGLQKEYPEIGISSETDSLPKK